MKRKLFKAEVCHEDKSHIKEGKRIVYSVGDSLLEAAANVEDEIEADEIVIDIVMISEECYV